MKRAGKGKGKGKGNGSGKASKKSKGDSPGRPTKSRNVNAIRPIRAAATTDPMDVESKDEDTVETPQVVRAGMSPVEAGAVVATPNPAGEADEAADIAGLQTEMKKRLPQLVIIAMIRCAQTMMPVLARYALVDSVVNTERVVSIFGSAAASGKSPYNSLVCKVNLHVSGFKMVKSPNNGHFLKLFVTDYDTAPAGMLSFLKSNVVTHIVVMFPDALVSYVAQKIFKQFDTSFFRLFPTPPMKAMTQDQTEALGDYLVGANYTAVLKPSRSVDTLGICMHLFDLPPLQLGKYATALPPPPPAPGGDDNATNSTSSSSSSSSGMGSRSASAFYPNGNVGAGASGKF